MYLDRKWLTQFWIIKKKEWVERKHTTGKEGTVSPSVKLASGDFLFPFSSNPPHHLCNCLFSSPCQSLASFVCFISYIQVNLHFFYLFKALLLSHRHKSVFLVWVKFRLFWSPGAGWVSAETWQMNGSGIPEILTRQTETYNTCQAAVVNGSSAVTSPLLVQLTASSIQAHSPLPPASVPVCFSLCVFGCPP